MSILDNPFGDKQTMRAAVERAALIIQETLPHLDEAERNLIEATSDGSSLADVLGITKEQRQALLDTGIRLIQLGQLDKASDVLMRLTQIDPLEERAMYALGVVCQMRGELQKAAQMYLHFLALDATNPMGYLRLGECLVAAREYDEAYSALDMARQFAAEGKGEPGTLEEALALLEVSEVAAAGAKLKQ